MGTKWLDEVAFQISRNKKTSIFQATLSATQNWVESKSAIYVQEARKKMFKMFKMLMMSLAGVNIG